MCTTRHLILLAAIWVSALFFSAGTASANPYPWCAVLNVGDAAYNCGFVSIEQCRATVAGIGGYCELNPFYVPPNDKPARRPR